MLKVKIPIFLRTTFMGLALSVISPIAVYACEPASAAEMAQFTLEQVLARVPQCHPQVRAAYTRVAQAQGDSLMAQQRPNPQLSIGANTLNKSSLKDRHSWLDKPFDHLVRIDQTFERGNKHEERVSAANAGLFAVKADFANVLRQATLETQLTYTEWVWAQAQYQLLSKNVDLSAQALQAMQQRVKAGDAPPMDLTRLQLEDTRLQSDKNKALSDTQLAQLRLGLLLGVPVTTTAPVGALAQPLTSLKERASAAAIEVTEKNIDRVEQRPDVQAAQSILIRSQHNLAAAQALRSRDINMGLQFNRYPAYEFNSLGTGNTVSVSVSMPLFLLHSYDGEIAKAAAELNEAQEVLQNQRQLAQQEAQSAWTQLKTSEQRKQQASDVLEPTAHKLAQAAEVAYQHGHIGMLERLDAQRNWRMAQIELLASERDWIQAVWQYQFATSVLTDKTQP